MKKELIGLLICTLLVSVAILPAAGTVTNVNSKLEKEEKQTVVEETLTTNLQGDDVDWWPMFQHDSQNTGYSTSKGPNTKNVLWSCITKGSGPILGSIAAFNGRIYVGGAGPRPELQGKIYCIDAETGSLMWMRVYPDINVIFATPVVIEDRVYVCPGDPDFGVGSVCCLNASNGDVIWENHSIGHVEGGPVVVDGKIYLGAERKDKDGRVFCLDVETGEEIWSQYFSGDRPRAAPAVANGMVYVGLTGLDANVMCCLDSETGEFVWNWTIDEGIEGVISSPTFVDNKVYFGTEGYFVTTPDGTEYIPGHVYCLDALTGDPIWTSDVGDVFDWSSPAVAYGYVYIGSGLWSDERKFYCLDDSDGSLVWMKPNIFFGMSSPGVTSPAVADGKVYVSSTSTLIGKLFCLDAFTGEEVWIHSKLGIWIIATHPTVADEKVFIGYATELAILGEDGEIFCLTDIDPDAPDAPTISGQARGNPGEEYDYTITTTDPNGDDVFYYITWGDGTMGEWIGPYSSGESVTVNHTWSEKGKYEVRARAKDTDGLRGAIGTLAVTMPKNHPSSNQQSSQNSQPSSQQSTVPFFFQILQRLMNTR